MSQSFTLVCNVNKKYNSDLIIFYLINLRFHCIVTSSARSSNVCKLHFLSHVIEYIIYRFAFLPLAVALFDTRCSIVYYKFSFLERTADSYIILHFCLTMLNFLRNLHFCRYAGCCIDCAFTLQFHFLCIYIFD